MPLDQPLTEEEFAQLDVFLKHHESPSAAMDSAMLDGYLTAVAIGPNMAMPSAMLRWVWDFEDGEESPEFESNGQAQTIIGLILRHYQNIVETLNQAPQDYQARLPQRMQATDGPVLPVLDEWCWGFYTAIAADLDAWAPLMAVEPAWFSTVLHYGTDEGGQDEPDWAADPARHLAAADSLAGNVRQIHAFYLALRRQQIADGQMPGIRRAPSGLPFQAPNQTPFRNPAKTGRNEPCPCGSGKKYKHCHGAN